MKIFLLAVCTAFLAACNSSESTTATEPAKDTTAAAPVAKNTDGWEQIFDGSTTKGWHSYGSSAVNSRWKVADSTIYLDSASKEHGDLVTDNEYTNFDFKVEWKISKNGNSGLIFLVNEDTSKYKETYVTGPEMQVLDNVGHPDGKITKHRAGDLYDLIKSTTEPVKPFGEWNHAEIVCNNGKLDLSLNGVNVVSTTLWDDNWKKLVAGSKFKSMPGFAVSKTGKIALQDHGNTVWYRNIMIKKL